MKKLIINQLNRIPWRSNIGSHKSENNNRRVVTYYVFHRILTQHYEPFMWEMNECINCTRSCAPVFLCMSVHARMTVDRWFSSMHVRVSGLVCSVQSTGFCVDLYLHLSGCLSGPITIGYSFCQVCWFKQSRRRRKVASSHCLPQQIDNDWEARLLMSNQAEVQPIGGEQRPAGTGVKIVDDTKPDGIEQTADV